MSISKNIVNHLNSTPQTEKAKSNQVKNSAGGFVFQADMWNRLERFLILGTDKPTYYASANKTIRNSFKSIEECLESDAARTVSTIVDVVKNTRAPKVDASIAALAYCLSYPDENVRLLARNAVNDVCRTSTQLFQLIETTKDISGKNAALCKSVANWYTSKDPSALAYQVVKYKNRNGWSHADALRISHPKTNDSQMQAVLRYASHGLESVTKKHKVEDGRAYKALRKKDLPEIISIAEELKNETSERKVLKLIAEHRFITHEMINNDLLKSVDIWSALLKQMGATALIRNLGRMCSIGVFNKFENEKLCVERINKMCSEGDNTKLHPVAAFLAFRTYKSGQGQKGSLRWDPEQSICTALEELFYRSFKTVEPTNKKIMLALDVSGSMSCGSSIPGLTCAEASALMAMVIARVEPYHEFYAFSHTFTKLDIRSTDSFETVCKKTNRLNFGYTDCSLPMTHAEKRAKYFDCFQIYTDCETYYGNVHPFEALKSYRKKVNSEAKLVVVAMQNNNFTIADPSDGGMLDVVGFDTAAPAVIQNFMH